MSTVSTNDVAAANARVAESGILAKMLDGLTVVWSGNKEDFFDKTMLFWTGVMYFAVGFFVGNWVAQRAFASDPEPDTILGMAIGTSKSKQKMMNAKKAQQVSYV